MFNDMLIGISNIFEIQNIIVAILGITFGIVVGALPGLSVTLGVTLMLQFTFGMDPITGLLLLLGAYCGGVYGGSITAILLKTPGSPSSAATAADGFALAEIGQANKALQTSLYASVGGGLISGLVLLFVAPQVAKVALAFGPVEYFTLAMFGLTIIAGVSGKSISKGLIMAALGLLISTIGVDPVSGIPRLTFGSPILLSGIEVVPALIGLFAISELLNQVQKGKNKLSSTNEIDNEKFGFKEIKPYRKTIVKSGIIGSIIGAIPGTGGAISSFIAYNESKRTSKDPDSYGKGNIDGIAAAESGNNGVTGATLIPMMTLGIPGDVVTAVLLGALMIQGLTPGPQLFVEHGDFAYSIMIGFIFINIFLFFIAKFSIKWFSKITLIPTTILFPIVLILCLVGTYAFQNNIYIVWITLIFGVLGYFFIKFDYPIPPLLIALILGPIAESSLRQSLIMSDGSMLIFLKSPIAILFIFLTILSVCLPFLRNIQDKRKVAKNS